MKSSRGIPDFLLLFLTLGIVGFGVVMVFSASFTISYWDMGNRWYFTQRQLIWAGAGFVIMLIAMNTPFRIYKKYFFVFFILSVGVLLLVFVPYLGVKLNGARSWLQVVPGEPGVRLQPAEFAKLGLIIYLAGLIAKKQEKMKTFKNGLLPPLLVTIIFFGLIALQPDFGTGMILLATAMIMIFVGFSNLKHIFFIILGGIILLPILILSAGYRFSRFTSFMHPWDDPYVDGYHLIQSLIAFGNGGITGTGFGKGIQKFFYLPYPQSDFIFSVIGEELGFIGVTIFLFIFLLFLWRILVISLRSKEIFGTLVGVGVVALFGIQAFINIGGVTGTIPISGVTLPFISTGGSSLIMSMAAVGIILSLSRENNKEQKN